MSKFYVDVQFKKQGCFSVEVLASDKQEATQKALTLANRKSTRLNSSHSGESRMPSSA